MTQVTIKFVDGSEKPVVLSEAMTVQVSVGPNLADIVVAGYAGNIEDYKGFFKKPYAQLAGAIVQFQVVPYSHDNKGPAISARMLERSREFLEQPVIEDLALRCLVYREVQKAISESIGLKGLSILLNVARYTNFFASEIRSEALWPAAAEGQVQTQPPPRGKVRAAGAKAPYISLVVDNG